MKTKTGGNGEIPAADSLVITVLANATNAAAARLLSPRLCHCGGASCASRHSIVALWRQICRGCASLQF
jgi:hypothetical protein